MPNTETKRVEPSQLDVACYKNLMSHVSETEKITSQNSISGFKQYRIHTVNCVLLHDAVTVLNSDQLSEVLEFCKPVLDKNAVLKRLVIPIAEDVKSYFVHVQHFVVLVIDQNIDNSYTATVVDSKLISMLNKDNDINIALQNSFPGIGINSRYCSGQQRFFDNDSCGYFAIKAVRELILHPMDTVENLIPQKSFAFMTSYVDWLTSKDIENINDIIDRAKEKIKLVTNVQNDEGGCSDDFELISNDDHVSVSGNILNDGVIISSINRTESSEIELPDPSISENLGTETETETKTETETETETPSSEVPVVEEAPVVNQPKSWFVRLLDSAKQFIISIWNYTFGALINFVTKKDFNSVSVETSTNKDSVVLNVKNDTAPVTASTEYKKGLFFSNNRQSQPETNTTPAELSANQFNIPAANRI